jgi:1-acyl-sn-glycerol-3-phosphate acyltransferase
MNKLFSKIYAIWFYIWTGLIFLVLLPFFHILLSRKAWYPWGHKLRALWGWMLLAVGFIRVKRISESKIDASKIYVVVANHFSYLDIISLSIGPPIDLNFMAKVELSRIPLFGIFFRTIDISVDRKNAIQSGKAYLQANNQLKNRVMSIGVFPEGGMRGTAPLLAKFKDGPFKMAIENGVDILPITLPDNWKRGPGDRVAGSPGMMRIYMHEPISTKGMTDEDIPKLRDRVQELIAQKLKELNS